MLSSFEVGVNICAQHSQRPLHVLGPCQDKVHGLGWQCSVVAQSHPASAAPADLSPPEDQQGTVYGEGQQASVLTHNNDRHIQACFYLVLIFNSTKFISYLI